MRDGTVLDERFELRGWASGGALGEVLRARDRATGRTVAVRIGLAGSATDEYHAHRLARAAEVRAPELVEILAHGTTEDDERYVALGWLDGTTALDRLRAPGLTAHEALTIAGHVARALAALHAHGVVHGAPTCDHVVVREHGSAVLLEPGPGVERTVGIEDDVRAFGRLLVLLLTGRALEGVRCPALPGRVPGVVGALVDDLLAHAVTAEAAATRLDALRDVDDSHRIQYRGGTFDPEATGDIRGGRATASVLGRDDTAAAISGEHARTPDLSTMDTVGDALVVKSTTRYRLEHVIGEGGLGRVVLAHDRELHRPVAIKELLRPSPANIARFEREAMVTARLQHPSIVPVHEAGRWPNGAPYYAMKHVEGQDLAKVIAAAPDLAGRLALLPKVIAVADAIAYAHQHRILHRDLKPSNVVLGEFGETVVIDWGLAKDLDADESDARDDDPYRTETSTALTRAGDVLGTPAYMAPEQARGEAVDAYTDVYALGAMLYHLLAGHPPQPGTSAARTRRGSRSTRGDEPDAIVPLAELVPDAPVELVAIATKAMAPAPADRYPSANELAQELRRFETGQLVSAHTYSPIQILRRWARRHRAMLVVGAILAAISTAIGAYALVRIVRAEEIAVRERTTAIEERERAEAERDRLRVEQAEAIVRQDPTAALELLRFDAPLPGDLGARAVRAATRATALGLAFARHQLPGRILELVAGGDRVVAISGDGTLASWDRGGRELARVALGAPPVALAVSSDGKHHAVVTADRRVRWWTGGAVRELAVPRATPPLAFIGSSWLALAPAPNQLWLWDGVNPPVIRELAGTAVALRPLGDSVIVATDDGTLARLDPATVRWSHRAHPGAIRALVVTARDAIVTAGAEGVARRWSAEGMSLGEVTLGWSPHCSRCAARRLSSPATFPSSFVQVRQPRSSRSPRPRCAGNGAAGRSSRRDRSCGSHATAIARCSRGIEIASRRSPPSTRPRSSPAIAPARSDYGACPYPTASPRRTPAPHRCAPNAAGSWASPAARSSSSHLTGDERIAARFRQRRRWSRRVQR